MLYWLEKYDFAEFKVLRIHRKQVPLLHITLLILCNEGVGLVAVLAENKKPCFDNPLQDKNLHGFNPQVYQVVHIWSAIVFIPVIYYNKCILCNTREISPYLHRLTHQLVVRKLIMTTQHICIGLYFIFQLCIFLTCGNSVNGFT